MKSLGGETEGEMGTLGEGEWQRGHVKRRTCSLCSVAGYAKPKAEKRTYFYIIGRPAYHYQSARVRVFGIWGAGPCGAGGGRVSRAPIACISLWTVVDRGVRLR